MIQVFVFFEHAILMQQMQLSFLYSYHILKEAGQLNYADEFCDSF